MKILCGIMTSRLNVERIHCIRQTWGSQIDHVFYSDHEDSNVLKVSDDTTYHSNEEKQINFANLLKVLGVLDTHEWVYLVDDDTFVNVGVLQKRIAEFDFNTVHGFMFVGKRDLWNPIYRDGQIPLEVNYVSGGAGVLLSRNVVRRVGTFENYRKGFGDVSLGLNFHRCGIPVAHTPLMNWQNPDYFKHSDDMARTMISYHETKTKAQFEQMWKLVGPVGFAPTSHGL